MKPSHIWLSAFPIILCALIFQLTFDLGEQGKLSSRFFREHLYPVARSINGAMTNVKFKLRGELPPKNKIVIVEADDASISALGRWPWHREIYAQLIHSIFKLGASEVALDVSFSEPENRIPKEVYDLVSKSDPKLFETLQSFEGDPLFSQVISKHRTKLALGFAYIDACQPKYSGQDHCPFLDPEYLKPIEMAVGKFAKADNHPFKPEKLQTTALKQMLTLFANIEPFRDSADFSGFFNVDPDSDGYIRRYPLITLSGNKIYPSLALKLAEIKRNDALKLEFDSDGLIKKAYFEKHPDAPVPVTPLGYIDLNFRGPSRTFTYVNAVEVLQAMDKPESPLRDTFKDATVLFGATAMGVYDMRAFPFDSNTPGVEGHATAVDNLLSNDELRSASGINLKWLPLIILLIGGIAFAVLFSRLESIPSLLMFVGFVIGEGLIDAFFLFKNNINLPTAFLLLETLLIFALILSIRYILEEKNKKFVRDAFSKYLAPQVVDLVLRDPSKLAIGGERKELTVLFSDLRGFTSFSENMDPKTLTQFLNEYLSEMTEIVFEHEGTLDKYIGDALMAFWGAPLHQDNHIERAWSAAVKMNQRLKEIAPALKIKYGIDVSAGIGINAGVVSVGNMGSKRIFEYTVIGDHVNLASRLEGLTKLYGVEILSTEETFKLLPETVQQRSHYRLLDSVKVKGKKTAVGLIQILDQPMPKQVDDLFQRGRVAFRERQWDTAKSFFLEANQVHLETTKSADRVSQIFAERCDDFKQSPPPEHWDGTIEMRQK